MSEPTSLLEILPQLKGASLACLYALCLVSDPVTTAWLAKVTGCTLLTTRRGLLQLSRLWLARDVEFRRALGALARCAGAPSAVRMGRRIRPGCQRRGVQSVRANSLVESV